MNNDPKYIGVPNICFSLTDDDDDREDEFSKQRIKTGFDDSETWSLDGTISNFIIPRLERFIEITDGMHKDDEDFTNDCRKLLKSLKMKAADVNCFDEDEYKEGIELFPKIFDGLWW